MPKVLPASLFLSNYICVPSFLPSCAFKCKPDHDRSRFFESDSDGVTQSAGRSTLLENKILENEVISWLSRLGYLVKESSGMHGVRLHSVLSYLTVRQENGVGGHG